MPLLSDGQLEITSRYHIDSWLITARVHDGSDKAFPRNIFLWTLNLDGSLGEFRAIAQADQLAQYADYDTERTSNFGVHVVKHNNSVQRVSSARARDDVITVLKKAFTRLKESIDAQDDPVVEIYS